MSHAASSSSASSWISPCLLGCATLVATLTVVGLRTASLPPISESRLWSVSPESPPVPSSVRDGVFPDSFIFGVSTSAYQIEGAWLEGGKGLSNWDAMSHIPGFMANGDTGDVADDHYHRFAEDVALMAQHGIRHYRFSLSWPRIMPAGTGDVNPEGVAFYNRLIDCLVSYNITPYVTLFHSDVPLALTMYPRPSNNPFMAHDFPAIFANYSDVAFRAFGDRVKVWFTFNEPWCSSVLGVPGGRDPYLIAHGILLAHAQAVALYRTKYRDTQQGRIGLVLNSAAFYPRDPQDARDVEAARRVLDFQLHWFLHPVTAGSYPEVMRQAVGGRLPTFSAEESASLRGSVDVLGLNYYMSQLAYPADATPDGGPAQPRTYWSDINVTAVFDPSWPTTQMGWGIYAPGLRNLLLHLAREYPEVPVMVTENGMALQEDNVTAAVHDTRRQAYLHDHVEALGQAMTGGAGSNLQGYFVWSLLDNLEWSSGFDIKFGMVRVERPSMQRVPKHSLLWYQQLLSQHTQQREAPGRQAGLRAPPGAARWRRRGG